MTNQNYTFRTSIKPGDMAVQGLLAGIVAGAVMLTYLVASGLAAGDGISATLMRFASSSAAQTPTASALLHLAVSAIYGLLFGVLVHLVYRWRWLHSVPLWAAGLVYGLLLLLLAQGVLLPSSVSGLAQIPLLHWVIAHILYGVVLGIAVQRWSAGM